MNPYQQRMDELEAEIMCADEGVQAIHLSEEQIASAESKLGHPFPHDYRAFLQDFGCYELDAYFFVPLPFKQWVSVGLFLGIIPSESTPFPFDVTFDLLATYRDSYEYLPAELISIATNSGPNRRCLAVTGDNEGAIFWWDRMVSFDSSDGNAIYRVASSFD